MVQVEALVSRLKTVEAQIAQQEKIAGADLATLRVSLLPSTAAYECCTLLWALLFCKPEPVLLPRLCCHFGLAYTSAEPLEVCYTSRTGSI